MSKERRLGRGLEALLGRSYGDSPRPELSLHVPENESQSAGAGSRSNRAAPATLSLPIQDIHTNPFQPRRDFDPAEITALAESIKQHGLIQPILVRARRMAISSSPANGGCGRPSKPAGPKCPCSYATPTIARWPS